MKFLADAGISPRTVTFLSAAGHDALHVRKIDLQRAADALVLQRAKSEERVLLTSVSTLGRFLPWVLPISRVSSPSGCLTRRPPRSMPSLASCCKSAVSSLSKASSFSWRTGDIGYATFRS